VNSKVNRSSFHLSIIWSTLWYIIWLKFHLSWKNLKCLVYAILIFSLIFLAINSIFHIIWIKKEKLKKKTIQCFSQTLLDHFEFKRYSKCSILIWKNCIWIYITQIRTIQIRNYYPNWIRKYNQIQICLVFHFTSIFNSCSSYFICWMCDWIINLQNFPTSS
jgi:hypothetical protein